MKKSILAITLVFTIISITAFGFMNWENAEKTNTKPVLVDNSRIISFPINSFSPKITKVSNDVELVYSVRKILGRTVTQTVLTNAQSLEDIIPHFPINWIKEYHSVELSKEYNGEKVSIKGKSHTLNKEQISFIQNTAIGENFGILVDYSIQNSMKGTTEQQQMDLIMNVIPEKEAEFIGGYENMIKYLKENSTNKLEGKNFDALQNLSVYFTVNEIGSVEQVKVNNTSFDLETDNLITNLLNKMPKWEPAKNAKGKPVKQKFEFTFGVPGC